MVFLPASAYSQEKATNQTLSFQLLLSDNKCQIAIWLDPDLTTLDTALKLIIKVNATYQP
jgi:hypothetical protein